MSVTHPKPIGKEPKASEITRVRRVATGLLIGLAAVFLTTFTIADPPMGVLLIRAMAEAGMVGGLADWFAVEALFRRPLGLPIPHTALLPSNQKRAAKNIARFIDTYFLTPQQVLKQISQIDPVQKLANWLSVRDHAERLARDLTSLLTLVATSHLRDGMAVRSSGFVTRTLTRSVDPDVLAGEITALLQDAMRGQLLDDVLLSVQGAIDSNRPRVLQLVQDRSRWWIATTVDKKIVEVLVDGVLSIVGELAEGRSDLRRDFETGVTEIINRFHSDGSVAGYVQQGLQNYESSPEFAASLDRLIGSIQATIAKDMNTDPDHYITIMADALQGFAIKLQNDPDLGTALNEKLASGLEAGLDQIRPAVVRYISQTVADWDSSDLVERLEAEVGRDLQFIRINGAALGALVGGCIFGISHLLSAF
jgi:uncharacterized membrane-anchored protein YjiN (DUF445 family)